MSESHPTEEDRKKAEEIMERATYFRPADNWNECVVNLIAQSLATAKQKLAQGCLGALKNSFGDNPSTCHCYSPKCVPCMVFLEKKRRSEDVINAILTHFRGQGMNIE